MTKPKAKKPRVSKTPATVATPSTLDEVERQLARIRARLSADDAADPTAKMSANVYAKLSVELRGWVKLRNEIEYKATLTENRVATHPKFIELRDQIVAALVQYPDAARAVAQTLGEP